MEINVLILFLLDFVLIAALPRVFFLRSGSFNLRWWSTALPVGLCPASVLICLWLDVPPLLALNWLAVTRSIAVLLFACSIALIMLTIGTHRVPIALWHQDDDAPAHIVTWGAYRRVRHPFYTAFLVAFTGAVLAFPQWPTLVLLTYMVAMLTWVAAREEQKLSTSQFGAEYRTYMTGTGRFLPRLARPTTKESAL